MFLEPFMRSLSGILPPSREYSSHHEGKGGSRWVMHVKVTATWMTSSKISSIILHFNGFINVTHFTCQ